MEEILNDFSVRALAAAIEANMFEYFQFLGSSPFVELYYNLNITGFITGIPHPFLNGVFRTQLASDDAIEETLKHFKSQKVPFMWWTGLAAQSTDWGKYLEARGLVYGKYLPGMAVDVLELNEDFSSPSGLIIKPISDEETLEQFVDGALFGYGLPDSCKNTCIDMFASLGFDIPLRNYVGLMDGKPVAASQLFIAAGVAGIYWVATVPEYRGQGIGRTLTLAPLRDARAMGYRIGILQSSEMGLGVYRRLGFEEYCKLSYGYYWHDETQ